MIKLLALILFLVVYYSILKILISLIRVWFNLKKKGITIIVKIFSQWQKNQFGLEKLKNIYILD
ncbi:hypothetical protein BpHYR1_014689 [Brachionus plicatilis]|uniref:Uncharacterized protein n=1 Tax=Brachionus plicatilis TaxID=10195 RepID=A0A3M7RIB6_BRAPC|nr:hypothetical protein BpHYR1_014689 [Brachionus plicatilis]